MFLQNSFIISLLFGLICLCGFSQNEAINTINVVDLERHLAFISSDSLQGRKLGTDINGLEITANYLANSAKKSGLKPGLDNYFQNIGMVLTKPDKSSFIEIVNKKNESVFKSNSIINLSGGAGVENLTNEDVVFAGFGFEDEELDYNDLADVDIKGKIVIVSQGNLKVFKDGKEFRWNNRLERAKIENISKKAPQTIVIITNPKDKENSTFPQISQWMTRERYALEPAKSGKDEVQTLIALPEFADKLLGKNGSYEKYLTSILKKGKSNSHPITEKKLNLKIGTLVKSVEAKNVIGIIEGSDPDLKEECVVFMAHYDHLGVAENGDVYNGADDNGSGTVTLLEVAEAFMSLEQKPKRSIVFLWVTAEELGLLGSGYYSENPIFPLDKTVLCINIDMDGRVYEPRDSVWNKSPKKVKDFDGLFTLANDFWPELKTINSAACKTLGLIPDYSLPPNFLRSSDHYSFHKNNVPILNYATGYHADYHKVTDEISKINFEKMKRVADLCFLVGYEIANKEDIKIGHNQDK